MKCGILSTIPIVGLCPVGFWPVGVCLWEFCLWDFGLWDFVRIPTTHLVDLTCPCGPTTCPAAALTPAALVNDDL